MRKTAVYQQFGFLVFFMHLKGIQNPFKTQFMTRFYISVSLLFLVSPFVLNAQYLADNKSAPARTALSSPISATGDSIVKTQAAHPSNKASRKPPVPAPAWQKEDDRVTGNFSKDIMTTLKGTSARLVGWLYDSCLDGVSIHSSWHGEFRSDKTTDSAGFKYGIKCTFPAEEGHATGDRMASIATTLEITANDLSPLTREVNVYGHDYNAIVPMKAVRNGCPYFEPPYMATGAMVAAIRAGKMNVPHIHSWLVTAAPDELPYVAMSRKEFLEEMSGSLKMNKDTMIKMLKGKNPVRPQAIQDAEKEKTLESFGTTYRGAELQMRRRNYLDHYKSDEDDLKEIIDIQTAPLDSAIAFIEGMLHRLAPATLAAPAYVPAKASEFEGFADGEEDAVLLVHLKKTLTASPDKPRYFLLSWTYDPADTHAALIKVKLDKKLDPAYMKDLLKK